MTFDTWQKNLVDASGIKGDGTLLGMPTWQKALANISGGGMTLLHSEEIEQTITSTSAVDIKTIKLDSDILSDVLVPNKMVVVIVTSKEALANSKFYSTITVFPNYAAYSSSNYTLGSSSSAYVVFRGTSSSTMQAYTGSNKYGIYAGSLSSSGDVKIQGRYNSTNSGTISGKYKVEIFVVDIPEGTLFPKKG